ncbi:Hypothetical protein ERS075564_01909 [Mycobacteroides abscessus]|uniref:Uncharacterized protein n=4 Tax=Mycobacteroides abscessus TaxID=36809 RepID=A0A0U1AED3_9MYCO|nr:hypothetical protein MASS_1322 [Mycobacteroides abscessus subsp. bolletii 50594]AIC72601.1 hypothetical protein MYCMA_11105 [Mycobacteroides abscessus subsp. massiliense str. GO 06]AMU20443.1 hypothetical protein A3N95_06130 [Mycobacteroides abscessus]EHB99059.1 hypothetical protein MAB47J26_09992 [Mycobacteroides abscessus 47J26]ORA27043.1 hypothetical protein BST18_14185 [Mycobacteroides abscessus subsp. bolletii]QCO27428.1 hypothetical protein CFE69_17350 [Mycobacteroides abscessus subsp
MKKSLCAAAVLVCLTCRAPTAAAEPGNPAAPIPVPGGTPNYAATAAQPPFGLSPAPPRGARISAGVDSGYTARIGAGTTAGQLEDPRGITQGVAP